MKVHGTKSPASQHEYYPQATAATLTPPHQEIPTMFAQLARRAARPAATAAARRTFADAAPASGLMKLNFNLPQETLYDGANVKSVVVPGATGEYEVTADHVPIVAEMKAGMMTINHEDGEEEKYFVAGGFSLTHEGSTTVRGKLCVS